MTEQDQPRRILVTGASGDIGRALLAGLPDREWLIGAHYHAADPATLDWPATVIPLRANLLEEGAAAGLIDRFADRAGGLDVLVQLSGAVNRPIHWTELTGRDWRLDLEANLISAFNLVQAAHRYLRASRSGRVVLTSTASVGKGGGSDSMAYGAAKAGVEFITKRLARDLAQDQVMVNCVAPGYIDTKFHTKWMLRDQLSLKARVDYVPLGRPGSPEAVARMIGFLISRDNDFVTGQVMTVDGGDFI